MKRRLTKISIKSDNNTGFGTNAKSYGGRFVNKDGKPNIEKRGIGFFEKISWYHTLIEMSLTKFLLILFVFYILINFIFASLYFAIGIEYLDGISQHVSSLEKFGKAFFFSAQTFTTVGYGHISPNGFLASTISAAEALIGLLCFAIATGIFYGRFSRPKAYIKFAHNALISPYKDGTALMFRLVPFKNAILTDAEVKITLGIELEENGVLVNKFYSLKLEIEKINLLSLSWTLVHPIDEQSPLYKLTEQDFRTIDGELLIFLKAFDAMYSNTVAISTSYTFQEIIVGAKFDMMYQENETNTNTILNLDKLNSYSNVSI